MLKGTHRFWNINCFFEYLLKIKKGINGTVFIDYDKINNFSIVQILDTFLQSGYLLHGSFKKLKILHPSKGGNRRIDSGNFKAVFGTDSAIRAIIFSYSFFKTNKGIGKHSWPYLKKLLIDKNWVALEQILYNKELYIYIVRSDYFVKIPLGNEYVNFKEIVPDYVIGVKYKECSKFVKIQESLKSDIDRKTISFFNSVREIYLGNTRISEGEHGFEHAISVANFGCIIAKSESPESIKDIMVGAFLHDIGRTDNYGGNKHAIESSKIAKKIIEKHWKDVDLDKVVYAIRHHANGHISSDKIIGTIWDADRLDRIRFIHKINLDLLSTVTAKECAKTLN